MRKTSQDGGDNTSITSGVENEIKKPIMGIMKTKRNSIKRKVQNFSHESDDAVIEPLLQKDKTDIPSLSAKHVMPKTKTESSGEKGDDRDKLLSDESVEKTSFSNAPSAIGITSIMNGTKDIMNQKPKLCEGSSTIHNHMNTNIFGRFDGVKNISTPKTKILVEIDSSKSTSYNSSPLIFTTAKIHTDGSTKQMEPVQVTPVPILSTIEGSVKFGVCSDKIITESLAKGNNMINNVNAKPNDTELKTTKDIQDTKTNINVTKNSGVLPSVNQLERHDEVNAKKNNPDILGNSSIKPIGSLDINNVTTKTIKSDLNTVGSNASTKCIFDNKDVSLKNKEIKDIIETCKNIVDVNKNIETSKTLTFQGRSSDNSVGSTSSSVQKKSTELNEKKDSHGSHKSNTDAKEKTLETLPVSNTGKTNNLKYNTKDTTSLPASSNAKLISSANNVPTTTTKSSVQNTASKLALENVTSIMKTTATSTLTKSATPSSTVSTTTSPASKSVSSTAIPVKTTTTNVASTGKTTISKEPSFSKPVVTADASNILNKFDHSTAKISTSVPSSKVKSTVSTIISTPKISATKHTPVTSIPIQNVTSILKTPSTQLQSANTISMSSKNTTEVTINTNTEKPVESSSVNSKLNNLTKTISSTVDSNKTTNTPINIVPNSTSSTVFDAPEIATKATISTSSVLKPSTSVASSKPAVVSTAVTSNNIKQPPTKPALSKSNNSTVSSVKTLITSSDKPSSTTGSIKNSSIKSSKQTESKGTYKKA